MMKYRFLIFLTSFLPFLLTINPANSSELNWQCNKYTCDASGSVPISRFDGFIGLSPLTPRAINGHNSGNKGGNFDRVYVKLGAMKSGTIQVYEFAEGTFYFNNDGFWDETINLLSQLKQRMGDVSIDKFTPLTADYVYGGKIDVIVAEMYLSNGNASEDKPIFSRQPTDIKLPVPEQKCVMSLFSNNMSGGATVNDPAEMLMPLNLYCYYISQVNIKVAGDRNFQSKYASITNDDSTHSLQVLLSIRDSKTGKDYNEINPQINADTSENYYIVGQVTPDMMGNYSGVGYIRITIN